MSESSSLQQTPTSSVCTSNGGDKQEQSLLVTPDTSTTTFQSTAAAAEPTNSDVLCGRGGSINSHEGNERFRQLVEKRKRVYLTARFKREKRLIASSIVSEIHQLDPAGRFLTRDKSGAWRDIGDEKARDKTSQALRENAPSIRAEIETEINEQRAEMQRAEEEEAARTNVAQHPHPYYSGGWGGYPSYYGYGRHGPPPPSHPPHGPPPPSSHGPPPSHPHAGHAGYHSGPYGQWGGPPPPGYPAYPPPQHDPYARPQHEKSALEQTADLVSSGAESIKNWTKQSFSFAGALDNDSRSVTSSKSKPISYVHNEPDSKKRRMVKFQDNAPRRYKQQSSSSAQSVHSNNSLMQDIEPHSLEAPVQNGDDSLMNQVANQILVNFGSWDTSAICGHDNADYRVPFPESQGKPRAVTVEEEMAVEWEGQEVQLTDKNSGNSVASDERMPPPVVKRRQHGYDQASSVGFSSLGSCHSWLPDQMGSVGSFFTGSRGGGISPCASMDMDYNSAGHGTEQFSTGGSLGGGSLTRVFEHETLPDETPSTMTSPNMSHRNLSQIPSWERSLRSRSPLSIGSDDDESLVSKAESVLSKGSDKGSIGSLLSGLRGAASPTNMDMAWESSRE